MKLRPRPCPPPAPPALWPGLGHAALGHPRAGEMASIRGQKKQRGFSLLEILVAFAIAALALGMIYRSMGSDARTTIELGQRQRALRLAQSLLAAYTLVPPQGVHDDGESAGFAWRIESVPYPTDLNSQNLQSAHLHQIKASVSWGAQGEHNLALVTLRPERLPATGSLGNIP